tara:strand:+ start:140 stop:427 length:288 start_codon:yes stop_codon:yes gene_type:complete
MTDLFGIQIEKKHDWRDEWLDMPEYNNIKPIPPQVIATFKFRNQEDFELFMNFVKENLFNGKRVFDGKQKKNDYSAWYPLDSRPSEHIYIVENEK